MLIWNRYDPDKEGWVVQTITGASPRPDAILTRNLVLSAGLSCVNLLNPLLPRHEHLTAHYTKGQPKAA
jgi:2-hydroxyglutarate dehydrogenase